MATSPRPATSPQSPRGSENTFTRNLKFEFADEEGRALVGSYAISIALGVAFLLLVHFGPETKVASLLPPPPPPVEFVGVIPEPTIIPPVPAAGEATVTPARGATTLPPGPRTPTRGNPRPNAPGSRTESNRSGAIGDAFGTGSGAGSGGLVGDASNILGGVAVNSGSGGTGGGLGGTGGGGTGGKVVLGNGQGGQGSTTPGRGGIGGGTGTGGGGGGGIGGVGGGGGVVRSTVRVSAPAAISVEPLKPGRNVDELGTYVRSRESQLRFCYQENGLKVNPNLAGSITVAIDIAEGGAVRGANVTRRSWSGAGASESEACIIRAIRGWRFPSSAAGQGTYAFPFSFTR